MKRTAPVFLAILCFIFLLAAGIRLALGENILGADYYIYYMAGRSALFDHLSPYDPGITLQTQIGILGHPAPPGADQLAFVYPAFALLPLFPFFLVDFDWSQSLWMATNILLMVGVILTATTRPKLSGLSYLLFYPVAFSLILGNLNGPISVIVLFAATRVFLSSAPSRALQIAAGVLLSWAMIKPQFIWFFALFFLLAAIQRRLYAFLLAFAGSLALLVAFSWLLWPGWIAEWLTAAQKYSGYVKANLTVAATLEQVLSAPLTWTIVVILLIVCLGITALLFRRALTRFDSMAALQTLAWVGFVTYLFHPNGTSYEQLTLFVPFLSWYLLDDLNPIFHKTLFWIAGMVLSWGTLALTLAGIYPRAVYDLPLIFFTGWILYIGITHNWKNLFTSNLNHANL